MNIILRELRANLKSMVIWSGSMIALSIMMAGEFSSMKDSVNINEMMDALPEAMKAAFSLNMIRFDQARGYFSYTGQYFLLMALVFASLSGVQILSKEISKKTVESSFTLPVTRRHLVVMKFIASIINCFIFSGVIFLVINTLFSRLDDDPDFTGNLFVFTSFIFLLQVTFVLMGMFISVLSHNHKRAGTLVASITMMFYLLSFVAKLGDKTEFLKYFTPFEYFSAISIMHNRELETYGFIIIPILIVVFFSVSFVLVKKKDIYI